MSELTIRNGRLFLPTGLNEGNLSIENGKIKKITRKNLPKGKNDIDAEGKLVIPGAIDSHGHFYDPNYTHREDFKHGSKAAAAGGVTTIISMPLDTPILKPNEIKDAIEAGQKNSIIDFSLHAGNMTKQADAEIDKAVELGIKTFKIFTCDPYKIGQNARRELLKQIKKSEGKAFIHAEDNEIIKNRTEKLKQKNRTDPLAHAEARPNKAEKKAVMEVIEDQIQTNCPLHFAHISSGQGARQIGRMKTEKRNITAETCPHFLLLTKDDLKEEGPYLRTNPPLRTENDVRKLWNLLSKGIIDTIATDHAPGTHEEKRAGRENIWEAQIGIPGVETLLPLMFSEGFEKGRITLGRLVQALCTNPAKIFGLYPRKGTIEEGTDADLLIIDREKSMEINDENTHYKVGWTPFKGKKVKGFPTFTISRGEIISNDGEICGEPGRGNFYPTI